MPHEPRLRAFLRFTVLLIAVAASVATRTEGDAWTDTGAFAPIETAVFVHNPSERDVTLRIRPLAPGVELDCDAISEDPGLLLPSELFGPVETWIAPPRTNIPIPGLPGTCGAARLDTDGLHEVVVWWPRSQPFGPRPGSSPRPDELPLGGIILWLDEDGEPERYDDGGQGFVHLPRAPGDEACPRAPERERIEWTTGVFPADTLVSVEVGVDGCLAVQRASDTSRWYLCVDEALFPWSVGDRIEARNTDGAYRIRGIDGDGSFTGTELAIYQDDLPDDLPMHSVPDTTCTPAWAAACGSVAHPLFLGWQVDGQTLRIDPGSAPVQRTLDGVDRTVHLVRYERLVAADRVCGTGDDLELAILTQP